MKGLWVEIRAGKGSLSSYHHGQNRLDSGKIKLVYYQSNESRIMRK